MPGPLDTGEAGGLLRQGLTHGPTGRNPGYAWVIFSQVGARAAIVHATAALAPPLTAVECIDAGLAALRNVTEVSISAPSGRHCGVCSCAQSNSNRHTYTTSRAAVARFRHCKSIFIPALPWVTHELTSCPLQAAGNSLSSTRFFWLDQPCSASCTRTSSIDMPPMIRFAPRIDGQKRPWRQP